LNVYAGLDKSDSRRPGQVTFTVGQVANEQKPVRGLVPFLVGQMS